MENFGKILKVILAGLGIGLLGFLVSKNYKKEVKKLENKDAEEKKNLAKVGIDKERFDKEMIPGIDDNNLVKALYLSVDSEWDEDVINIQNCIDNENVIHLGQSDAENTFNMSFEIPAEVKGDFNSPTTIDFLRELGKAKRELEEKLTKEYNFNYRIFTGLEGYFIVKFKNIEGHNMQGVLRVSEELYRPYATEKHDGFVEFVNNFREKGLKAEDLVKSDSYDLINVIDLEILDIKVLYRMSVKRQFVNIQILKDMIKYLMDNIEVKRGKGSKVTYDYVMFNTLGPAGNWSLLHYYEFLKGKGIVVSDYEY